MSNERTPQAQSDFDEAAKDEPTSNPDPNTEKSPDEQAEANTATHEETTQPLPDGRTSTGYSPAEEAGKGVGGDRTIAPGGPAGPGSGPVNQHGGVLPPVHPPRDVRREKNK